jgi:hypothetical protein
MRRTEEKTQAEWCRIVGQDHKRVYQSCAQLKILGAVWLGLNFSSIILNVWIPIRSIKYRLITKLIV